MSTITGKQKISEYNKKYRETHKELIQSYYKKSDEEKQANRKIKQEQYFNVFKEIIEKKNGILLSTSDEYINAHSKLKIKCSNDHEFECTLNNISKNRWCPFCNLKINECVTLCALEYLFDKQFKKIRPNWLQNLEGNNLEIDCFNEELKLCVEYNGIQHYEFVEYFHKTEEVFLKRNADDKIKKEKCIEKGYVFIEIPYTVPTDNIIHYIANQCIKANINFDKSKLDTFDITEIDISDQKHNRLLNMLKEKNGELIDGKYITRKSILTIMCNVGHIWTTNAGKIIDGSWCHTCGLAISENRKKKISTTMKEFFNTEEGAKSKEEAHKKRSVTMEKIKEQQTMARKEAGKKICKKCNLELDLTNFCVKSASADGYQSWCKVCTNKTKQEKRKNA
jgi:uncharacterized protein YdaU (DUF1376 family)